MPSVNCLRIGALTPSSVVPLSCGAPPLLGRFPRPAGRDPRQPSTTIAASSAAAGGADFTTNGVGPTVGTAAPAPPQAHPPAGTSAGAQHNGNGRPDAPAAEEEPQGLLARVKRFFTGSKLDKARLAALGFGAFSAYGVISNINAGILITIAWITIVRTTGMTPLDAGNWPRFAAVYAGLWIGSNFLRPIRLTLALAAAPLFDAAIGTVSARTGLPRVPAFVVMLLLIAAGTTSALVATIAVLGGFPPGCRMPWQPA